MKNTNYIHDLPLNKICVIEPVKKTIVYEFDNESDADRFGTPQRVAHLSNDDLKQNKTMKNNNRISKKLNP